MEGSSPTMATMDSGHISCAALKWLPDGLCVGVELKRHEKLAMEEVLDLNDIAG